MGEVRCTTCGDIADPDEVRACGVCGATVCPSCCEADGGLCGTCCSDLHYLS